MSEYDMLLRELEQAQQNFQEADPDHINKAIYDLMYAEMKFDAHIKERSEEIEGHCGV